MTAADMLPLDVLPHHGVDEETTSLLALIHGDPVHDRDRRIIVTALLAEAHSAAGKVDTNRLRARLTNPDTGALTVTPVVIGATINALATRGVLRAAGWTTSTDHRGKNAGKPCRVWRLVQAVAP